MSRIMTRIHDEVGRGGHHVEYFCSDDVPAVWRGRAGRLAFPLAVMRHVSRATPAYDLVNVHEPSGAPLALWRRAGTPRIVVTTHGVEARAWRLALDERRHGRAGPSLKTRLLYPATALSQCRVALTRADHVLCLNSEDRAFLATHYGIEPARTTRIWPGADPIYGEASTGRTYQRAERLVFFGTWRKNKGTEDLVPAFVELADRHPALSLTLLGTGVADTDVVAAFPTRVQARIRPVRHIEPPAAARALAEADIFVLPSLFEGTPLTLIEAMMSGLPIVTTATCGMKDVIVDRDNGLLVPIRSPAAIVAAVDRLVSDPALRARVGQGARTAARARHTWRSAAQPVAAVYESLGASTCTSPDAAPDRS